MAIEKRQQLSMSFRLQRQRGIVSSGAKPWLIGVLFAAIFLAVTLQSPSRSWSFFLHPTDPIQPAVETITQPVILPVAQPVTQPAVPPKVERAILPVRRPRHTATPA